jgi:hypothetical protein
MATAYLKLSSWLDLSAEREGEELQNNAQNDTAASAVKIKEIKLSYVKQSAEVLLLLVNALIEEEAADDDKKKGLDERVKFTDGDLSIHRVEVGLETTSAGIKPSHVKFSPPNEDDHKLDESKQCCFTNLVFCSIKYFLGGRCTVILQDSLQQNLHQKMG